MQHDEDCIKLSLLASMNYLWHNLVERSSIEMTRMKMLTKIHKITINSLLHGCVTA